MAFSRSLLIKGVAGLGTCAAGGIVIHQRENIFGKREINLNSFTDKQLIDKVGLDCKLGDGENEVTETKECSVKTNGKINVKNDSNSEDDVTFQNSDSGGAKLKVSKSTEEGYSKNLKFVVDSGDINLTKTEGTLTISKLEQFETYEVTAEKGGKFYLSRKTKAKGEKEKALGLDKCEFPESGDKDCTFTTEEIKKVKFEGQTDGVTITENSTVTLKISKVSDTSSFPDGYRFTFTFPSDVTINSNSIKGNIPTDFKVKKPNTGNAITLEKAWSDDNSFTKKAGLDCSNKEQCSVSTDIQKLNVKVGGKKKEGITSLGTGGKIKLEKDQQGYNQGFKFTITTSDITLTGGTGDSSITKLEELETYEITEESGKYYLTKKSEKDEKIKTSLGLPSNCNLPTTNSPVECTVPADKSKDVKFDGQETNKPQVEFKLKIEKTNDTLYPLGYKFTLISEKEVTISSSNSVKANTNTVFKIKKDTSNPTNLTLEKALTIDKLLEKVGLKDCTTEGTDCSIKDSNGTLNIKRGDQTISATAISTGKIKFKKDQADYNQGFKFTIEENDVTLTGATEPNNKLEELETYEITEQEGNYYLTRKTTKEEAIKKSLSIPDKCFTSTPKNNGCSLTTSELSEINFDGKEAGKPTVEGNGGGSKAKLTVSKVTNTTDFPLGYKFTFLTTGEMTISNTNKVKANVPTEFKIKKGSTPTTLTLEKAWSDVSKLIEKVGLENCSDNSTDCNIKTSGSPSGLNVKQENTTYENKNKSSSSTQGKIKLYKDQKGYIEGMKFVIEENDVTLENSGSGTIKLTQYETYEIEQKDGKYYLSRKTDGKEEKIKKLGLPDKCKWDESSASSQICSISKEDLKNVKFKNKKSDTQSLTGNENITVMFEEETKDTTTHPMGLKVSFISTSTSEIKIPLNNSSNEGSIVLKPSTKKEFKITKEESGGGLSLERAFDISSFAGAAGLQNCYDDVGCSLKEKINVWLDASNYRVDAKVSGSNGHKITYVEGKSGGYNKGVEFTPQSNITFENADTNDGSGSVHSGNITSLTTSDKFQIKQHEISGTSYWFLSKITAGNSGS